MASIRTARVIAAVASVPLAFGLLGGIAQADNTGAVAGVGSSSSAQSIDSGFGIGELEKEGVETNTQQSATGRGNSNENNTVGIADSAFTFVDQSTNAVVFGPLW